MKLPVIIKIILCKLFLKPEANGILIYNYIKYDAEENADIFLVFIKGIRGYLFMNGVEHTDTSVAELVQGLEQDIKSLYNETGCDYEIRTVLEGQEPEDFQQYINKALEPLTLGDKFKSFIGRLCYC
jgi:hypothetical protein